MDRIYNIVVSWSVSIFAIVLVPLKQMVSDVSDQAHQNEKIRSDMNFVFLQ